jgi:hypothetical protein
MATLDLATSAVIHRPARKQKALDEGFSGGARGI